MDTQGNKEGKKAKLDRKPAREFHANLSKDGKYWLLRDTTTWFIPVNYLAAIQKSAATKSKGLGSKNLEENGGADGRSH